MNRLIAIYKGHYKALFYLGLPIVIGQMGVIVLGFADTLMVGHHSTAELAAASFTNNLFTLCIIFSTGFSYGLTPVVGEFYGNRRFMEAGQALRSSLLANVLVALLLTLIMTVVYFCAVAQQSSTKTPATADAPQRKNRAGTHISLTGPSYPSVVVTPEGGHAVVMPPCGNTSVVVNPDGSHSIAIVNGSTATIVTP